MKSNAPRRCVVLATHNQHKVREIQKILGRLPLPVIGLDRFPSYGVRETGKTLEANALLKARVAVKRTGRAALSDDTGLEVKALNGEPGVYSARYAGPGCNFLDNNRKLLRKLAGVPAGKRTAVFRCVVALVLPNGKEKVFVGRCAGRIIAELRGVEGFGYDPVFQPSSQKKTFAEMSLKEKNKISHRSKAFQKASAFLDNLSRRFPEQFVSKKA